MTPTARQTTAQLRYAEDAVLSATPSALVTMLYDRLLLDLRRADAAGQASEWADAAAQAAHAGRILGELSSTLKPGVWDGSEQLATLYGYVSRRVSEAIVHKDVVRLAEAVDLLEPIRQAWHEAAAQLPGSASRRVHVGARLGSGEAEGGELGVA